LCEIIIPIFKGHSHFIPLQNTINWTLLTLSIYIYIYIYIHKHTHIPKKNVSGVIYDGDWVVTSRCLEQYFGATYLHLHGHRIMKQKPVYFRTTQCYNPEKDLTLLIHQNLTHLLREVLTCRINIHILTPWMCIKVTGQSLKCILTHYAKQCK
jgi:hypothetical protein